MARVKRGVTTRAKHKRLLDQAKGYYGRRKNTIRIARQAVEKAGQYAYRDRKVKKRTFRALWIQRINAAVRAEGLTYGQFMHGLKLAGVELDRKVLADIAMHEGEAFKAIIAQAKAALSRRRAASGIRRTRRRRSPSCGTVARLSAMLGTSVKAGPTSSSNHCSNIACVNRRPSSSGASNFSHCHSCVRQISAVAASSIRL